MKSGLVKILRQVKERTDSLCGPAPIKCNNINKVDRCFRFGRLSR